MDLNIEIISKIDPQWPHILFIGGCGEFGMNVTAYIYKQNIYLIDCGLAFASDHEIGIDAHIADLDDVLQFFGGPKAYFITHGHEDHIGALPLFLEKWPAPVYLTKWSSLILDNRLSKFRSDIEPEVIVVQSGNQVICGELKVDWCAVPHSIPGCCALILHFGPFKIFHTGDFKMDPTPPLEQGPDLNYLASLAPIDLLVADSTNSLSPGFCPSETTVEEPLKELMQSSQQLLVVTTFASNLWRILSLVQICQELQRKLYIVGPSLLKTLDFATQTGLFHPDPDLIISDEQLRSIPRDRVVVLASGSQGEPRSGLRRIVMGEHRHLSLQAGDHVVFSARIIPGNEKSVAQLVSECHRLGVKTTTTKQNPNIHVSGHAYQEDIQLLLQQLKPLHYVPVHGTHTHLVANGTLYDPSVKVSNGTLIKVSPEGVTEIDQLSTAKLYIDSWSQRPLSYKSMRSRHKIGDSGLILITGSCQGRGLDCEFIGVPFNSHEQDKVLSRIKTIIAKHRQHKEDTAALNERLRLEVRRYATEILIKKPVVICKLYSEA